MYFNNEVISFGGYNYIGLPLKKNVKLTQRCGIEILSSYRFYTNTSIGTIFSYSYNKINNYSDGVNTYSNITPFATPSMIMNNFFEYKSKYLLFGLNGNFVSKNYLDNTQNESFISHEYYILNGVIGTSYKDISITFNVNNLLNTKYYLPGGVYLITPTYYPGSLRNYLISLRIKFI